MDGIETRLKTTEKEWLPLLYRECRNIFSSIHIPSHDQTHHYRVWEYCRSLIKELTLAEDESFIRDLMIAVFFHDTGMSRSPGPRHGFHSMELCRDFLLKQKLSGLKDTPTILNVINDHDRKDYPANETMDASYVKMLQLLSICDDLDAYGAIGIYRYLEIYLLRNIPLHDISYRISANLDTRFRHMEQILQGHEPFISLHRSRQERACTFFSELNNELQAAPAETIYNYRELPEKISIHIIGNKMHPFELASRPDLLQNEAIKNWASDFIKEWKQWALPA